MPVSEYLITFSLSARRNQGVTYTPRREHRQLGAFPHFILSFKLKRTHLQFN
jgi:hypothetical protein